MLLRHLYAWKTEKKATNDLRRAWFVQQFPEQSAVITPLQLANLTSSDTQGLVLGQIIISQPMSSVTLQLPAVHPLLIDFTDLQRGPMDF
jgi:hypothetical protein